MSTIICKQNYAVAVVPPVWDPNNPVPFIYLDNASFAAIGGGCIPGLTQRFTLGAHTPTFVNYNNDGGAGFVDFFPPVVPGGHFTMELPTTTVLFIADKAGGANAWFDGPAGLYVCSSGGSCGFIDVTIVLSL